MTLPSDKGNHGMSKSDSGRVQSSQAKGGGNMSSGGFASRAQAAGDRNQAAQLSSCAGHSGGQ
ncbi:hypothetical protein N7523_004439 [Penicillium sp. IBT 18751x]|nr:hypothetical protein N7523_004439 [Penicillium sp. IBT 18751x]